VCITPNSRSTCDFLHVVLAELDVHGTEVFKQMRFVAGTGDRNDVRPVPVANQTRTYL
jgi:hypothetical protein